MKAVLQSNLTGCPICAASVLKFERDQFCLKCNWSTMRKDVKSGRFEKRLGLRTSKKINRQSSIVFISGARSNNPFDPAEKQPAS